MFQPATLEAAGAPAEQGMVAVLIPRDAPVIGAIAAGPAVQARGETLTPPGGNLAANRDDGDESDRDRQDGD